MSRISILYVSMIVVFVAGLWTVVRVGRTLKAPHDLSGTWAVVQPAEPTAPAQTLTIAQSGRFAKVKVNDQKPVELVLASQTAAPTTQMVFENGGQRLTVAGVAADNAAGLYRFLFDGPVRGEWTAKRETAAAAKPAGATH